MSRFTTENLNIFFMMMEQDCYREPKHCVPNGVNTVRSCISCYSLRVYSPRPQPFLPFASDNQSASTNPQPRQIFIETK